MSGAKHRMRDKKMRNQPSNVTYTPTQQWHNGDEASHSGRVQDPHRQSPAWFRGHRGASGQDDTLPRHITASTFANARAAEVSAMLKAVTKTTGSCHVFGALPKHMRRRAMSHNPKRLPSRLREAALKMQEKSRQKDKKDQPKSKSRKARRRHGNLLLEFNRRQRKNVWLETHIWHAKRFHMVKKWGYCLAQRPTYKCYRACHRAMSGHCLLQDMSYYCCVELAGEEELLLRGLSSLTSKDTGPTFAAAPCLSGRRQGSTMLYRAHRFPADPLGPALFLWRPPVQSTTPRQLWLWVHPTMKQDLLLELQVLFQCLEVPPTPQAETEVEMTEETPVRRKRKSKQLESGIPAKKIVGDGTRSPLAPTCWMSESSGVTLRDLSMEIVRFRLIGPLSHSVLSDTLTPASPCQTAGETSCLWWADYSKQESNVSVLQRQSETFQLLTGLCSSAELPASSVLGLTVDDPRATLPARPSRATPVTRLPAGAQEDQIKALRLHGVPEPCCQSCLWDQAVRDNVTENKIPEKELNRMKSEQLVPGLNLSPTPPQCRVPVLLVQQPGKHRGEENASWGVGWDLLLPKGWAMAFWVPLVYRGVRVGGLQEALKHSQNKGEPHFPHDFPDCPAGARFARAQEGELCDAYKRRPPAKRPNYIKRGCLAPFLCPWQQLVEEWEKIVRDTEEESAVPPQNPQSQQTRFTVLRNRKVLRQLSVWCRPTSSRGQRSRQHRREEPVSVQSTTALCTSHPRSLVWVRLSLLRKGRPALHAMICAPVSEDWQLLRRDPASCGPQEPRHAHHRIRKGALDGAQGANSGHDGVPGVWADPLPSVSSHCTRVTLGWSTHGDFSLAAGCGEALGFVSLTGLLHVLAQQPEDLRGLVLIRNPASLQYRFAKINMEA